MAIGDGQHGVAGELKAGELRIVALERLAVAVMLPALELDDQPGTWPVRIDEEAFDVSGASFYRHMKKADPRCYRLRLETAA